MEPRRRQCDEHGNAVLRRWIFEREVEMRSCRGLGWVVEGELRRTELEIGNYGCGRRLRRDVGIERDRCAEHWRRRGGKSGWGLVCTRRGGDWRRRGDGRRGRGRRDAHDGGCRGVAFGPLGFR